mgnify:CR=1 FL=1
MVRLNNKLFKDQECLYFLQVEHIIKEIQILDIYIYIYLIQGFIHIFTFICAFREDFCDVVYCTFDYLTSNEKVLILCYDVIRGVYFEKKRMSTI